jgi:hypothetical protein
LKKLGFLIVLALDLAVGGCGGNTPTNTVNTATAGNWEVQFTGGTDQASLIDFVTAFSVTNSGPIEITGFSFINAGKCFANGVNGSTETGNATLITGAANQVTGTLNYTVTSRTPTGNTLTLTGNLTGTSNGTPTTTGSLSNGIVVGTWALKGGAGDPSCGNQSGTFLMCQGTNTCTPP